IPAPVAKAEVKAEPAPAPAPVAKEAAKEAAKPAAKEKAAPKKSMADEGASEGDRIANQSIRVNVDTLEHLMTMVSELVLTRNQLLEISRRNEDTEFKVPLQRLSNVTAELQEGVMKTRMQPIGNAWQKLPRIVRDLSSELGKQIELEMHGADTELDRQVLDLIKDPLTHMVRNSADHGLETPAERLAAGKGEQGTIRLSAYHEGGHIIICIADNGRGLNTERIKAKAISSGLVTEAELEKMSEAQIHKFIFAPGFSTAAAITSVSGRGVGMDVVRTNIDQIGGTIDIKSVAGEGSSVTIKIP
ncbi:ATPase, partial [Bradyrhizobium sp. CCBAU 21362]